MLPSKHRNGLSDTSNNKTIPPTPKAVKVARTGSTKSESGPSPIHKSRISPKTAESKPTVERRLSKDFKPSATTPNKQPRAQLGEVQVELKKAKEQLASVIQEKAQVLEELNNAKNLADEANEKLNEALAAQKRAEESSEVEKFRADELEQANIEASQKKEEEWGKELDSIKKKHSLDAEALLSTAQELEKVKDELEMMKKAKDSALSQAEDAVKIAETNAEKVETLSNEITRLKSSLDSKFDNVNGDASEIIKKLDYEIDSLRDELERAKQAEEKLVIMDSLVERLSTEADSAKSAELSSLKLVDEWRKRAEDLEIQLVEAEQSQQSSFESSALVKKQLEEAKASMQDSGFEISALKEKIELLEDQLAKANQAEKLSSESQASLTIQLEELNASLQDSESEIAVLRGKVESLEIEVADVNKAKLDSDKKADLLEIQLAEANQFNESSSDSLASVTKQLEESNSSLQDVLADNAALRVNIESLEIELDRCKEEAIEMRKKVEALQSEIQTLENEKFEAFDAEGFSEERNKLLKEIDIAKQEEAKAKMAMESLAMEARETQERFLAKRVEHEDANAQIEQLRSALRNTEENYEVMLDETRYEIVCLKKAIEKLKTEAKEHNSVSTVNESEELNTDLEIKENGDTEEENEEKQLSESLNEAATDKFEESCELSNSEKEYDMLPNSKEIPIESVNGSKEENGNGNQYLGEEEPVEVEVKMWEGYKAVEKEKDFSSEVENENESLDEDLELKIENGSFDEMNGLPSENAEDGAVSPSKQLQTKKKKPLFQKFGNLLKKKSPNK